MTLYMTVTHMSHVTQKNVEGLKTMISYHMLITCSIYSKE